MLPQRCPISYIKQVILLTLIFLACNCNVDKSTNPVKTTAHKMYVYSNMGNVFYLIDYETFKVIREITLDLPDTLTCYGMCLSTNRDYLLFSANRAISPFPLYFVSYNIREDKIYSFFYTGFNSGSPTRFAAAQIPTEPGLAFFYNNNMGLYSFDFLAQKVKECMSDEHDFLIDKEIIHSPDRKWTVLHKAWGAITSHSELEFYYTDFGLHDLQFVLNQNDADGISIYDMAFSKDDKRVYISFQLSNRRSRDIESYFGSYDLETKQLYRAPFKLPWSLNPYYMAYSSKRQEIYLAGAYDKFYIIDTNDYVEKDVITLTGKVQGPSRIVLHPDENVAFVSCSNSDFIVAIDLNARRILKKIEVSHPYKILIP